MVCLCVNVAWLRSPVTQPNAHLSEVVRGTRLILLTCRILDNLGRPEPHGWTALRAELGLPHDEELSPVAVSLSSACVRPFPPAPRLLDSPHQPPQSPKPPPGYQPFLCVSRWLSFSLWTLTRTNTFSCFNFVSCPRISLAHIPVAGASVYY